MSAQTTEPAGDTIKLDVEGMSCASCVLKVEKALQSVPGVVDATVNLANETATVRWQSNKPTPGDKMTSLTSAIQKIGYKASIHQDKDTERSLAKEASSRKEFRHFLIGAALTLPLLIPMIIEPFGFDFMLPAWFQLLLATPVQFWLGFRFYRSAWKSVLAKSGNMDLLVAIGTTAAYGLSIYQWINASGHGNHELYFESSAVVITLVMLGKWLENRAKNQTSDAIRSLKSLRPEKARVMTADGETSVSLDAVKKGQHVKVLAGEVIPVDGIVVDGQAHVDDALITGESIPSSKSKGSKVIGGATNLDGVLIVETSAINNQSTLARIIETVESAQARKAPIQRVVDRVASVFVPVVLVIAACTLVGWQFYQGEWSQSIIHAVSVLVIACPCALGLATPTAIIVGTGRAAKEGILIKDGEALEAAHRIAVVAWDKTGTLTIGKPRVVHVDIFASDLIEQKFIAIASALQLGSEHPLAKAVLEKAASLQINAPMANNIRIVSGRGVIGIVEGKTYALGNKAFMSEQDISLPTSRESKDEDGLSKSWLAEISPQKIALGSLGFADDLKPTSLDAIHALKAQHIESWIISGDNQASAARIAKQLGVTNVRFEVMPQDKAAVIEDLKNSKRVVCMIGDGINDAPALAAADIGIAMGSGTDIAMQAAGITLMRSDPLLVPAAISISRDTYRKIQQNLFWAFIYNLVGIPMAATGHLSPVIAGASMAFSSVSVVTNSLLLKRWQAPRTKLTI